MYEEQKNKVFISHRALLKTFEVDCYLQCRSTALKSLNAFKEDKIVSDEKSEEKLNLISFFNSAVSIISQV